MKKNNYHEDIAVAKRLCKEILKGNREAIKEIYSAYHQFFAKYLSKMILSKNIIESQRVEAETILSIFWIELLDGKDFCNYEGYRGASLRTFLTQILFRRLQDELRKAARIGRLEREAKQAGECSFNLHQRPAQPDDEIIQQEYKEILHKTLLELSDESPEDADIMRMHFKGLSYKEMAERKLQGTQLDAKNIAKLTDSIRQRFNRTAKPLFQIIFKRCYKKRRG